MTSPPPLEEEATTSLTQGGANTWKNLFDDQNRVHLLQHTAPFFFGLVQRLLVHDIIALMARLTDPPSTQGNRNATIRTLLEAARPRLSAERQATLNHLADRVDAECAFCRAPRNKYISHLSYEHHVPAAGQKEPPRRTDPLEKNKVFSGIKALEEFLSAVAVPVAGTELLWHLEGEENWQAGEAYQALRVAAQAYAGTRVLGSRARLPSRDDPNREVLEGLRNDFRSWRKLSEEGVESPPDDLPST